MRTFIGLVGVALVLVAATPSQSSAQGGSVSQVFVFDVPPDQAGPFLENVAKVRTVVQRHAPENRVTVYSALVGTNPRLMVVTSEYPSAAAWGAAGPKINADPEVQSLGAAFQAMGVQLTSTVLQANVTPGGAATDRSGGIAMVFSLEVPPGQQGAALEILGTVSELVRGHESTNEVNVWSPIAGGAGPNRMTVVSEFPSAEVWGAAVPKIGGDAEYQRLGQQLAALGVEVVSIGLVADVTP